MAKDPDVEAEGQTGEEESRNDADREDETELEEERGTGQ